MWPGTCEPEIPNRNLYPPWPTLGLIVEALMAKLVRDNMREQGLESEREVGQVKRFGLRERDPFPNGLSSFYWEMSGCRCLEECVIVAL